MKPAIKRIFISLGVALLIALVYIIYRGVCIGTAYKAKILCSGVFLAKRAPEAVLSRDLGVDDLAVLKYFHAEIDYDRQSMLSNFLGFAERTALYRPGLGCTLVIGTTEDNLRSQAKGFEAQVVPVRLDRLWPEGELVRTDRLPRGVKADVLRQAVDEAFSEPDPKRPRRTRAVVVVYRGRIVAERYAPGVAPETPLAGWSMTKSVMNALIGILAREGKLSVRDPALLPEWGGSADGRAEITVDHLLRMTSGLEFDENYVNLLSDVMQMLLATWDTASYAADKPLETPPGSVWKYSSGTTNILSRVIRERVGGSLVDYFSFPRKVLFGPIGMQSAVIEPDAAGTFVGSSFMYATARDWARFGLLYLRKGRWDGKQVLDEAWINYTHAHTRVREPVRSAFLAPTCPGFRRQGKRCAAPDAYFASGHEGQVIAIIPSRNLVIVRLGLSRLPHAWDHALFISRLLEAFPGR